MKLVQDKVVLSGKTGDFVWAIANSEGQHIWGYFQTKEEAHAEMVKAIREEFEKLCDGGELLTNNDGQYVYYTGIYKDPNGR